MFHTAAAAAAAAAAADNREMVQQQETQNYSEEELRAKLKEYIHFIDHTLQPELEKAVKHREEIDNEIDEYNDLKVQLDTFIERKREREMEMEMESSRSHNNDGDNQGQNIIIQNDEKDRKAMVDLGSCQTVYCQARISNPNIITVDIGKGMYVQLTLEEARMFCIKRIMFLETNVLPQRVAKAQTVAGHLEDALSLLESLGNELRSSSSSME